MVEWTKREIITDEIPDCKTPQEIIDYTLSVTSKVLPNTFNTETALNGIRNGIRNEYRAAYMLIDITHKLFNEKADNDTKRECKKLGIILERGNKKALDKWSEISAKYDHNYYICLLMNLKWQAEKMMVEDMFEILDTKAPKEIKEKYAQNKEQYEYLKQHWQNPVVRKSVINIAFNFRI